MMSPSKKIKTDAPPPTYDHNYVNYWFNAREYNKIDNGLYLGSDVPVKDQCLMQRLEINHIISVKEKPIPKEERLKDIDYLHIEAGDFPDQDIISSLDLGCDYIESALKKDEIVFVNCGGGVSRSATVVLAYLMRRHRISYSEAYKRVYKKRKIFPNDGFVEQLKLFERMQWMANGYNEEYRRLLLKTLTYQLSTDGLFSRAKSDPKNRIERQMKFDYEFGCVTNYLTKVEMAEDRARNCGKSMAKKAYHCYICREELFYDINIIGGIAFEKVCPNTYIEPMKTYITVSTDNKMGYLKCPNCGTTFGAYNWLLFKSCCPLHHKYKECLAIKVSAKWVSE